MPLESLGGSYAGISISKKKNGITSFFITFKNELGKPVRLKIGESPDMTKSKAKEMLADKKKEVKHAKDLIRGNQNTFLPPILQRKKAKKTIKTACTLNELADIYFSEHQTKTMKAGLITYNFHFRNEPLANKLIQLISRDDLIDFLDRKKFQRSDKRRNIKDPEKDLLTREVEELQRNRQTIEYLSQHNDWRSRNKMKFLSEKNHVLQIRTNGDLQHKLWNDHGIAEDEKRAILGLLARKTISELMQLAKTIVNYAITEKELPLINPFIIPKKDRRLNIPVDNVRDRYMTNDEIRSFLKECREISKQPKHKNIFLMALLALSIAARQQTIMTIRISDIDFENGSIRLRNHKTEKWYTGFIGSDEIKEEILKLIGDRNKNDYLFINYTGERPYRYPRIIGDILDYTVNFNKRFFDWLALKDLRNTTASHLAMQGVPITHISQVLNHAQISMTQRYSHLSPDTSKDGVRNLVGSYGLNDMTVNNAEND